MANFLTETVIGHVYLANTGRNPANLNRRLHKWFEEFGELEQAYLSISSNNHRSLSIMSVREEACDVLIVAIDIALTPITNNFTLVGLAKNLADFAAIKPTIRGAHTPRDEYDALTMSAASAACGYATTYMSDPATADFIHGHPLVRWCFAIVDFVFCDIPQGAQRDEAVVTEIARKLAKWKKNRESGRVATDAE